VELGTEKETWRFYEKAAEEVEDEDTRKLFRKLAKIEEEHYENGNLDGYQDFSLETY